MRRSTYLAFVISAAAACTHSVVRLSSGDTQPTQAPFALTLPQGCLAEKSDTAQARSAGRGSYRCQGYGVIYAWGDSVVEGVHANIPPDGRVVDSTSREQSTLIAYRYGRDAHGLLRMWSASAGLFGPTPVMVRTESVYGGTQTAMRGIIESVRPARQ